ncbi:MAG: type IV toxin-antitoxin system AbiEi family antitoxin domain-containing protein, partial [Proteobacteria bacterium]|nr:type IV toxin-antitoxin system AbiEi family antitoxin domain-containing protein [Pseudomonadota bacterium]
VIFPNKDTTNCFDYIILSEALKSLRYPRNAIGRLLESGSIIRVKKGIYALGDGRSASVAVLANMIYGPSYVSQDFVLSQLGLIPERVFTITCMTTKRRKIFDTPVGRFEYQTMSSQCFAVGITHRKTEDGCGFLEATPEKALADKIALMPPLSSTETLGDYLFNDMRVDRDVYKKLSLARMTAIARQYQQKQVSLLLDHLRKEA